MANKRVRVLFSGFLVLGAIAGAMWGCSSTNNGGTTTNNAPTGAATAQNAKIPSVGGTITVDGVSVTLDSVKRVAPSQYDIQPKSGDSYYAVHVTIKNGTSDTVDYNEFDFHVFNGAGASVDWAIVTAVASNEQLSSGSLAPGGSVGGDLVAELPTGDKGAKLVWNPNIFDNSQDNAWSLGI